MSARAQGKPAPPPVEEPDDLDESELEPIDEPAAAAPSAPQTAIPSGPLFDDCSPEDDTSPVQLAPPDETERIPRFASGFSPGIVAGLMVVSFALGAITLLIFLQLSGRIRQPMRATVIDARPLPPRPAAPSLTVTPLPSPAPPAEAAPPPVATAPPEAAPKAAPPPRPAPRAPGERTSPTVKKKAPAAIAAHPAPAATRSAPARRPAPSAKKPLPPSEKAAKRGSSTRADSAKINWIDPFSK